MKVNWDLYTSKIKSGTLTNTDLLRQTAHGAVLDIGCGIGKHLAILDDRTIKVGIDAGLSGLQRGRVRFPDLALGCGDAYHLPLESASFDSAIMIDVIEHLDQPSAALQEVKRVLRPGGVLFAQTPNYPIKRLYDFWHYVRGTRKQFEDDPTHVSKFAYPSLIAIVAQAGFDISHVTARNVMLDWYFPPLRRLRKTSLGRMLGQKVIVIAKNRVCVSDTSE